MLLMEEGKLIRSRLLLQKPYLRKFLKATSRSELSPRAAVLNSKYTENKELAIIQL